MITLKNWTSERAFPFLYFFLKFCVSENHPTKKERKCVNFSQEHQVRHGKIWLYSTSYMTGVGTSCGGIDELYHCSCIYVVRVLKRVVGEIAILYQIIIAKKKGCNETIPLLTARINLTNAWYICRCVHACHDHGQRENQPLSPKSNLVKGLSHKTLSSPFFL